MIEGQRSTIYFDPGCTEIECIANGLDAVEGGIASPLDQHVFQRVNTNLRDFSRRRR